MQPQGEQAIANAQAHLATIRNWMFRKDHIQECDGEECELTWEEIFAGLDRWPPANDDITEARQEYHDEDDLNESLDQDPLSVLVRSGWEPNPDEWSPAEYEILLTTGGPALRIRGELDVLAEPISARLQYQDWGTPWTELVTDASGYEALRQYAKRFYYGKP